MKPRCGWAEDGLFRSRSHEASSHEVGTTLEVGAVWTGCAIAAPIAPGSAKNTLPGGSVCPQLSRQIASTKINAGKERLLVLELRKGIQPVQRVFVPFPGGLVTRAVGPVCLVFAFIE